ncbi:MAG TPA: hypothetical protein PKX48_08860 [Planctomycetota bacterium]|nr:hypothetical protein [Planctomycetota bacterium]OQC18884.1 MAG: hypothetical protein BWX69_03176 [Planctomycetes bacterium ADurb.Bin069]NMD34933.1 hypothetical protein [Planctomycetota bacterium]HNR99337.1 hypothetical protein [Planctomycetota bacterium]HNU26805.1 hypothetical protein [Planctomycetota bacterium]
MCLRSSSRKALAVLALAVLAGGCVSMQVPPSFLVIDKGASEFKAVSHDGARIWVRKFSDPYEGTLDFWAKTVKTEFVDGRGYTLIEEGTARDGKGREGVEFVFEVTAGGTPQRYLVDLFVIEGGFLSGNAICVVEYSARKPVFEQYLKDVRAAVATLKP